MSTGRLRRDSYRNFGWSDPSGSHLLQNRAGNLHSFLSPFDRKAMVTAIEKFPIWVDVPAPRRLGHGHSERPCAQNLFLLHELFVLPAIERSQWMERRLTGQAGIPKIHPKEQPAFAIRPIVVNHGVSPDTT